MQGTLQLLEDDSIQRIDYAAYVNRAASVGRFWIVVRPSECMDAADS